MIKVKQLNEIRVVPGMFQGNFIRSFITPYLHEDRRIIINVAQHQVNVEAIQIIRTMKYRQLT
jgi:hypothetical protein